MGKPVATALIGCSRRRCLWICRRLLTRAL